MAIFLEAYGTVLSPCFRKSFVNAAKFTQQGCSAKAQPVTGCWLCDQSSTPWIGRNLFLLRHIETGLRHRGYGELRHLLSNGSLVRAAADAEMKNHAWLLTPLRSVVFCTDKLLVIIFGWNFLEFIFYLWINRSFVMGVRFDLYWTLHILRCRWASGPSIPIESYERM